MAAEVRATELQLLLQLLVQFLWRGVEDVLLLGELHGESKRLAFGSTALFLSLQLVLTPPPFVIFNPGIVKNTKTLVLLDSLHLWVPIPARVKPQLILSQYT